MNRYREDTPYQFKPPRYSPFWAPVIHRINDWFYLKRKHRIHRVHAHGGEAVVDLVKRESASLLIAPNHSDHADPHVVLHLSHLVGIPVNFMAARQVFEAKMGLHGAVLQRMGVFSIDREATDLRSIKEAMRILEEGAYPLVMFPEGEIYHSNERLTPLNEGAATLALRVARKLDRNQEDRRVYVVPTAMKYSYHHDIDQTFPERLARLERYVHWEPQAHLDVVERIYKLGAALLALKEIELLGRTLDGDLPSQLTLFTHLLVTEAEHHYFGETGGGNPPQRIRRLRGKIRSVLLDGEHKPPADVIEHAYRTLDRLHVAIQLYSYPGRYLRGKPSRDRIAETLHKFEEDVFGLNAIRTWRRVHVTFCRPICVHDHLEDYAADGSATTTRLTTAIEDAIRAVLEKGSE